VGSLEALLRDWPQVLDLSAHPGAFAAALKGSAAEERVGPVVAIGDRAARAGPGAAALNVPDQSPALIVALQSLAWANDLPGGLAPSRL